MVADYDKSEDPLDEHLVKEYTAEDVKKHNTKDDCWIIV